MIYNWERGITSMSQNIAYCGTLTLAQALVCELCWLTMETNILLMLMTIISLCQLTAAGMLSSNMRMLYLLMNMVCDMQIICVHNITASILTSGDIQLVVLREVGSSRLEALSYISSIVKEAANDHKTVRVRCLVQIQACNLLIILY